MQGHGRRVCLFRPDRRAGEQIEGFVIEDSGGFMTKLKLPYYNFWKRMRAVAREVVKKGFVSNTAALATAEANEFYGWLRENMIPGNWHAERYLQPEEDVP